MIKYFEQQLHYLFYKNATQKHYITFLFKCQYKNGKNVLSFQILTALDLQEVKEPVREFSFEAHKEAAEAYLLKCNYQGYELIREAHLVQMNDKEFAEKISEERREDLNAKNDFARINAALAEMNQRNYRYLFWRDYYCGMHEPRIGGNDLGIRQSNDWGDGLGEKEEHPVTKVFEMDYKGNKVDYTGNGTMDIRDYVRLLQGCFGCFMKKM
jgi:hypothetical protein